MAWLTKPSGRRYYYRRRKVEGRVISEYIGGGRYGTLAAQLDDHERQEAQAQREALQRVRAEQDQVDRQIDELGDQVSDLVTSALLTNGYHTHKGTWRRKRWSLLAQNSTPNWANYLR